MPPVTRPSRTSLCILGSLIWSIAAPPYALGQCDPPSEKLLAAESQAGNEFGSSVAGDGTRCAIGAPGTAADGGGAGAVHIFVLDVDGWTEVQFLQPANAGPDDGFGTSLSLRDDLLVIGAPGHDSLAPDAGAAYVFRDYGAGWELEAQLSAQRPVAARFGAAVATDGIRVLVGVPQDDSFGGNAGAAIAFSYETGVWTQQQVLLASDGAPFDRFGETVSMNTGMAVIGAPLHEPSPGMRSGAAYVFRQTVGGWHEEAQLLAGDGSDSDYFGSSTAIQGTLAVVGAPRNDDHAIDSGAAYVFKRSAGGWTEVQKLVAADGGFADQFGRALGLADADLVIGAYREGPGAAYWFTGAQGQFTLTSKLVDAEAEMLDYFGQAVSVFEGLAVVGAPRDGTAGSSAGAALAFELLCPIPWCVEDADCDDGDDCTVDACTQDDCAHAPVQCDDGDDCTIESCVDGQCISASVCDCATDADCSDGNDCTTDVCSDLHCFHQPLEGCSRVGASRPRQRRGR